MLPLLLQYKKSGSLIVNTFFFGINLSALSSLTSWGTRPSTSCRNSGIVSGGGLSAHLGIVSKTLR